MPAFVLADPKASGIFNPTETSIVQFEKRVSENPNDFVSLMTLSALYARLARERGDTQSYVKAYAAAKRSLEVNPNNVPAKIQLSSCLASLHRFKEAMAILDPILAADRENPSAIAVMADCLIGVEDLSVALSMVEKLKKIDASDPGVLAREARIYELRGEVKKAIGLLAKAEKEQRKEGDFQRELVWYRIRIGELNFKRGNFDEAEKWYKEALNAWPQSIPARDRMAELTGARGKFDEAIVQYKSLMSELPSPELNQALGDLLVYAGRAPEAEVYYDKAVAEYEKSVSAGEIHYLHHLANFYSDSLPNPEKAIKYAKLDIESRKTFATYDALAWALYKSGDYRGSQSLIPQIMNTGNKDAHVLYHLGTIFSAAGDFATGKQYLNDVVKINPRYNTFHEHR